MKRILFHVDSPFAFMDDSAYVMRPLIKMICSCLITNFTRVPMIHGYKENQDDSVVQENKVNHLRVQSIANLCRCILVAENHIELCP
jgi:hypothetical protein